MEEYFAAKASGDLIAWKFQVEAAAKFSMSLGEVEEAIFGAGLLPARYQRNRNMLSTEQQHKLFRSSVAVIGCGGLGGYILEQLARLGVGKIIAIDPDVFEEHNLNRQLLSSPRLLGASKAETARARVNDINPALNLVAIQEAFDADNGADLVAGADVVVDAVDNVAARKALDVVCRELKVPLVHGAIAGWYGHVSTQYPGDEIIGKLYGNADETPGVEKQLGNPSFTPGAAASFQVAEVCKIISGEGELLRNRKLHIDLLAMETEDVPF
ncbi:thiamine biosynthesis protein ThiF [Syntrophotalea acetylenivorans]|uniref:Thiamine biosynthesis protein ThiF n=1 Tax=Syntrophotalea acetylenivorans TaxID=1842532 RepID=A0A1L3GSV9_9BACT|nr:thiamine biosynthesis protein ThiF [Syntrophotalea acetylenivorans]